MKIHFIQQDPWVLPGEYFSWAERNCHEISYTRCWLFESVPDTANADMLVILGGWQCPATTKEECAYFDAAQEKRLIREYADAGKIVIGVCLGAQLVGEALGAAYSHSPEREIGPVKAVLTEAGRADPFFASFPDVFLAGEWHNDMPGLTEDSVIIAESEGCPRQIMNRSPEWLSWSAIIILLRISTVQIIRFWLKQTILPMLQKTGMARKTSGASCRRS